MHNTEIERLYNSLDASYLLHVGADTLRQMARSGKISHRRIGRKFWFSANNINEFLAGKPVKAKK